jgi:hypothetical protein
MNYIPEFKGIINWIQQHVIAHFAPRFDKLVQTLILVRLTSFSAVG